MAKPDPERLAAWVALRRAHDVVQHQLEVALLTERDMPLAWYEVLETLRLGRGKLRATELAERAMIKPSTLSRQLERLEDEGLIDRDRDAGDARIVIVSLTSEGREVLRRASTTYARVASRAFAAHLTDTDVAAIQRVAAKALEPQ
jgi:DNA-binding MarR family transcriptional regulator